MNNEKRFVLFPNRYKEKDKQPDYNGEFTLDGVVYQISGWKQTKGNLAYVSGTIKPKEDAPQAAAASASPIGNDDGIPF